MSVRDGIARSVEKVGAANAAQAGAVKEGDEPKEIAMELKRCPTCKTLVFADMDVCYECMYRFGSDPERERAAQQMPSSSEAPPNPGRSGEGVREVRAVMLSGWNVELEASSVLPRGTRLRITIEPTPGGAGSMESDDGDDGDDGG